MVFVIIKLKVLRHKVSAIGAGSNDVEAELVECINEREKLRNFVDELSSLISSSLFMDFIVFSALLCALLFQASQVRTHIDVH